MTITRRMTAFWASLALTAGMFLTNGSACARALAGVQGDVNGDGEFSLVDVVCLQRWLHGEDESLADWKAGDLNEDDLLDVFDLGLVKYTLIHGQMPEEFDLSVLPEYSGMAWIVVGDNTPDFSDL
ncbi:MAG: dockerin type I repeat-containing protein, partial [Oscillospiraceae bacterium]|nr:dockerin type I repeat-containing protein [Oscillospiraceae bacterium]